MVDDDPRLPPGDPSVWPLSTDRRLNPRPTETTTEAKAINGERECEAHLWPFGGEGVPVGMPAPCIAFELAPPIFHFTTAKDPSMQDETNSTGGRTVETDERALMLATEAAVNASRALVTPPSAVEAAETVMRAYLAAATLLSAAGERRAPRS